MAGTHRIARLALGAALAFACWGAALPASGAGEPSGYEAAKVALDRLRGDEKRSAYRHEWLKSADAFLNLYTRNPDWNNRPAALFRSAEALEEMARRSFTRKDAQEAAARFEMLAAKHAASVLADDALYRAARIRGELMRDAAESARLLDALLKSYARSDHAEKAAAYKAELGGSAVASLGPAAVAPKAAPAAVINRITPQKAGTAGQETVRIVISLNRPVAWTVRHQAADAKNGRPARLTLDIESASPAKSLPSGERYTKMGAFSRFAVDYTASEGQTRILLDFADLKRYTVRAEKSPFRLIVEGTASDKALADGISVVPAPAPARVARAPRAVPPPNVAAQLGLRVRTIVIDPGHGGKDPGAMHNNLVERDVCLDIAKRLGSSLRAEGYKVVFTRERDTWVSLSDRARFAAENKGDLFVSIHVNASTKPAISGFETYFLDLAATRESSRLAAVENAGAGRGLGEMEAILADLLLGARAQEARRLADSIQDSTLAGLKKRGFATRDGGVKGAPFHVLVGSSMPGVLVEVGYCTNDAEAKRLAQSRYRDVVVEGLTQGIRAYARQLETAEK